MIDELLNNIPNNLTEVADPPTKTTLPRVSTPPRAMPQRIPVAHRTRACLAPPQVSSLVELVEYHVPTAKTTRLETHNSDHFAGLCQSLALSAPEVTEFAGLCEKLTILDDGGGRQHQATTNPVMVTMAAVADDDSVGGRTRHVDVCLCFLWELKESKILDIRWIKGSENDADPSQRT